MKIKKIFSRICTGFSEQFHRIEKDGGWKIYPQFIAHENPKNARKSAQKNCESFH